MRGLVLLLPLLLLGAAPATAQAPQLPPPSAEDVAVAAAFDALPAAERTARLAAAERMLTASEFDNQTRKSLASTAEFLMPLFVRGNEGRAEDVSRIVTDEFLAGTEKMLPLMRERAARRHAEVLTTAELDELSLFYSSPIGKRLLAVMPALQPRLMRDGGEVGQIAMRAALPRILDRLKAAKLAVPTTS
jgi:uncharacterized protein